MIYYNLKCYYSQIIYSDRGAEFFLYFKILIIYFQFIYVLYLLHLSQQSNELYFKLHCRLSDIR